MRFSVELRRDDLSGLWIAEVPQLGGVWASAFERAEAMARLKARAIGVVLDRYFGEHDTDASERAMLALLELNPDDACRRLQTSAAGQPHA